jgi:hypothetical protein
VSIVGSISKAIVYCRGAHVLPSQYAAVMGGSEEFGDKKNGEEESMNRLWPTDATFPKYGRIEYLFE